MSFLMNAAITTSGINAIFSDARLYFPTNFPYAVGQGAPTVTNHSDPLFGPARKSVPLPNAPLVCALAQVRFSEVFSISKKEFVADFQERIRGRYPNSNQEAAIQFNLNGTNPEVRQISSWKFSDENSVWIITLTTTFVSLQTRSYLSRSDFIERLAEIVNAVSDTIKPSILQRVGVRYVDQIKGDEFMRLDELVSPQAKGFESPQLREHIHQSMHDTISTIEEGKLRARWGIMPPGGTHDPGVLPPINSPSWVLDIDAFQELHDREQKFSAHAIVELAERLATRTYSVFRWAVTDNFIRTYGGNI
jgi:uncharacterized protein (TIGR04255 family)